MKIRAIILATMITAICSLLFVWSVRELSDSKFIDVEAITNIAVPIIIFSFTSIIIYILYSAAVSIIKYKEKKQDKKDE